MGKSSPEFEFSPGEINDLGRPPLPEQRLLRDALYLLQGISGKHVHFSSYKDNGIHLVNELSFVTDPVRPSSLAA